MYFSILIIVATLAATTVAVPAELERRCLPNGGTCSL